MADTPSTDAPVADIEHQDLVRRYTANPALATADLLLGKIDAETGLIFLRTDIDARAAFLAWADDQGLSDADWGTALMFLDRYFRPFLSPNGSSR